MFEITYLSKGEMYTDILGIDEIDRQSKVIKNIINLKDLKTGEHYGSLSAIAHLVKLTQQQRNEKNSI